MFQQEQLAVYQDITDVINLFRRQLQLLLKIESFADPDPTLLLECGTQTRQLSHKYKAVGQNPQFTILMHRFLCRIKEIVHGYIPKAIKVSESVYNYLKKIETFCSKRTQSQNFGNVFHEILWGLLPKKYQQLCRDPQNLTTLPTTEQEVKTNEHEQYLSQLIQGFQLTCKNLKQLNIDERDFRGKFFISREDWLRQESQLEKEMKQRNSQALQTISQYASSYSKKQVRNKRNSEYLVTTISTPIKAKRLMTTLIDASPVPKKKISKQEDPKNYDSILRMTMKNCLTAGDRSSNLFNCRTRTETATLPRESQKGNRIEEIKAIFYEKNQLRLTNIVFNGPNSNQIKSSLQNSQKTITIQKKGKDKPKSIFKKWSLAENKYSRTLTK